MNYERNMDHYWAARGAENLGPMVFGRWRKMIEYHLRITDKKQQRRIFDNCVRKGIFTRQKMARVCLWFYTYVPPLLERVSIEPSPVPKTPPTPHPAPVEPSGQD